MKKRYDLEKIFPKIMQGTDNNSLIGLDEGKEFLKFLNTKRFRVSDTSLSYRQINSLDENRILSDDRKNRKDWRKFSFKELIFLSVIKELRKYGIRDKQLIKAKDIFFGETLRRYTEIYINLIFKGAKFVLVINSDNDVIISESLSIDLYKGKNFKSFVNVNLNEIVMDLWEKQGRKKIEYDSMLLKIIDEFSFDLREAEIIKIIRDREYKKITVRKNDDKTFIVKAEKATKTTEDDLMEIIKKKDFADFSVVKRDGNIVNIKIEDTYKV